MNKRPHNHGQSLQEVFSSSEDPKIVWRSSQKAKVWSGLEASSKSSSSCWWLCSACCDTEMSSLLSFKLGKTMTQTQHSDVGMEGPSLVWHLPGDQCGTVGCHTSGSQAGWRPSGHSKKVLTPKLQLWWIWTRIDPGAGVRGLVTLNLPPPNGPSCCSPGREEHKESLGLFSLGFGTSWAQLDPVLSRPKGSDPHPTRNSSPWPSPELWRPLSSRGSPERPTQGDKSAEEHKMWAHKVGLRRV